MNNLTPNIDKFGKLLVKCLHGSRLYGLDWQHSDFDYKGVILPSIKDCLTGKAFKNYTWSSDPVHSADRIQLEFFSLTEFIKHLRNGEGYAIDIIHAPQSAILESFDVWNYIVANKKAFYTKKMRGTLNYCKNHAVKYSLKAERLNAVRSVSSFLQACIDKNVIKLGEVWDDLPKGTHIEFGIDQYNRNEDKRYYEVAGKKVMPGVSVIYAKSIFDNLIDSYGDRAKKAAEYDEKDTKAICHAFRTGYQLLHIYKDGGFTYPLPENKFLRDIKFRTNDYLVQDLDSKLNDLITEVESLALKSEFPDSVNDSFLDGIIYKAYNL
jgi:hypothetical protein